MYAMVPTVTVSSNVVGFEMLTPSLVAVTTATFSGFRVVVVGVIDSCSVVPVFTRSLMVMLEPLLLLATMAATASLVDASSRRRETPLTFGWRFKRGDLPFNGGPLLCSDQLEEVRFPISLKGKACALQSPKRCSRLLRSITHSCLFVPHIVTL